ncbi:MAG: patatin-like phospholipase family protein [Caldisericaceae bacterium]|nr:patatin-like phospholipase family protein [Caldisericaceae bacterium]
MKKIGLTLSGGGARGLAHIGVLKVLEENGITPCCISGASMGAIVGGVYVSGATVQEMESFVNKFVFGNVLDKRYPLYKMQIFEKTNSKFMKYFSIGLSLNALAKRKALDSGRKILYMFKELTQNKTFKEAKIPFQCTAVDLISGKTATLKEGSIALAMRASMSIPLVFEPVKYGDMLLVDGGVTSNAPVGLARKMGADFVIAVNVNPPIGRKEESEIKTPIDLLWRVYNITANKIYSEELTQADFVIHVDTDTETLDFSKNAEQVKKGEEATRKVIEKIKELAEV